jgi:ribosomal protein S18 acetylase RimI-like enzyme
MNQPFVIRKAAPEDAPAIARFNIAMAMETEGKTLKPEEIEPGVRGLFDKPEYGFYLMAETEAGEVAGSLMITFEWSDWRNGVIWWIQSVYVMPEHRRKGVYRAMYSHVKTLASRQTDVCGIRLYVEKENRTAQRTYSTLGMEGTHYRVFEEMFSDQK